MRVRLPWRSGFGQRRVSVFFMTCCFFAAGMVPDQAESLFWRRAKKPPSWIENPYHEYKADAYLAGVGFGETAAQADERSLAALARIFETRVQDILTDSSAVIERQRTEAGRRTGESQSSSRLAVRSIQSTTDQVIEGARIVERFEDSAGQFSSLAVLEKKQAERLFRDSLGEWDETIESLLAQAQTRSDVLQSVNLTDQALQAFRSRQRVHRRLAVVSERAVPPPVTESAIRALLATRLSAVQVLVETDGETAGRFLPVLEAAASEAGLTVSEDGPVFRLLGTLDMPPLVERGGWHWLNGSVELSLVDENGTTTTQYRQSLKASSRAANLVENRLFTKLEKTLPETVYQMIIDSSHNSRE